MRLQCTDNLGDELIDSHSPANAHDRARVRGDAGQGTEEGRAGRGKLDDVDGGR